MPRMSEESLKEKLQHERNAHFQHSARQVAYKVLDLIPDSLHTYSRDDQKLVAEVIAQYAYDLAYFVLDDSGRFDADWKIHETIEHLPDLPYWPQQ